MYDHSIVDTIWYRIREPAGTKVLLTVSKQTIHTHTYFIIIYIKKNYIIAFNLKS